MNNIYLILECHFDLTNLLNVKFIFVSERCEGVVSQLVLRFHIIHLARQLVIECPFHVVYAIIQVLTELAGHVGDFDVDGVS